MSHFKPPFSTTSKIIHYISDISEALGKISILYSHGNDKRNRDFVKEKRILSALAVEEIFLSLPQIKSILQNSNHSVPDKTTQRVLSIAKFYDGLSDWNKDTNNELLSLHKALAPASEEMAGSYRLSNIANGKKLQMAPQALHISKMMDELITWFATSLDHPLITSSVFHYELKFIHPFIDANTLVGCLWQTKALQQWNPLFSLLPIESIVANSREYYDEAIHSSTESGDSSLFIEYMLKNILASALKLIPMLQEQANSQQFKVAHKTVDSTVQVNALINVLEQEGKPLNRKQLQAKLALKDRKHFRERYLKPALDEALIEMTIPDKPNSKLQQYRLII